MKFTFELKETIAGQWKATVALFNPLTGETLCLAAGYADSPTAAVERAEDGAYQELERVCRPSQPTEVRK